MGRHSIKDLANEDTMNKIRENICNSCKSIDKKVLDNFSNEASSLLNSLN